MHKGSKETVLPLLSASHETGVRLHCFRKITLRESATRQVELEAGRVRSQFRGGTLRRGPHSRSGNKVRAHPLARPLGRRREVSRQELTVVPLAWGCRSAPGTFEGDVPQTQVSRWRHGQHSRVSPGATRGGGGIALNKGVGGAQVSGFPHPHICRAARRHPQVPNPERAPVFVNKPVTWPQQPAPRP